MLDSSPTQENSKQKQAAIQLFQELQNTENNSVYLTISKCCTLFSKYPIKEREIKYFSGSSNRDKSYQRFFIPKKRGGLREINAPTPKLKNIQRTLLCFFSQTIKPHKTAKGFVKNESIASNAILHKNKNIIYNLDLLDFFPTIKARRIYGMFLAYPFSFSKETARVLTNLTTYMGFLPQGAPTSPFLSNILCRRLDSRLYQYSFLNQITYSRYADDLSFSTNKPRGFSKKDKSQLSKIINEEGFEINQEKVRFLPHYKRQVVTGIVINKKLNIKREEIKALRAILFNIERFGWETQVNRKLDPERWDKLILDIHDDPSTGDQDILHYSEGSLREYELKTRRISKKKYDNLKKRQSTEHFLTNFQPGNIIKQKINSIKIEELIGDFKDRLKGRIEFLSQIRNYKAEKPPEYQKNSKDDKLALALMDKFKWLNIIQNLSHEDSKHIKEELKVYLEDISENKKSYSKMMRVIDKNTPDELAKFWDSRCNLYLEFIWLLNGKDTEIKNLIKGVTYSTNINPKITGLFFKYFLDQSSIEGLMHDQQFDAKSNEISIEIIYNKAKSIYKVFESLLLLPNCVKTDFEMFLQEYGFFINNNKNVHPWRDIEFRNNIILPYKRKFRFDEGDLEGTDLINKFQEYFDEKKRSFPNKEFAFPSNNVKFFTHTESAWNGIRCILDSMLTNGFPNSKLSIELKRNFTADPKITFLMIKDESSSISKNPNLAGLFGNKLKQAVFALRGLAEWKITASFKDNCSYDFDVMKNQKLVNHTHQSGVLHILEFY